MGSLAHIIFAESQREGERGWGIEGDLASGPLIWFKSKLVLLEFGRGIRKDKQK
jgi:hypothetical protein